FRRLGIEVLLVDVAQRDDVLAGHVAQIAGAASAAADDGQVELFIGRGRAKDGWKLQDRGRARGSRQLEKTTSRGTHRGGFHGGELRTNAGGWQRSSTTRIMRIGTGGGSSHQLPPPSCPHRKKPSEINKTARRATARGGKMCTT